MPTNVMGGPLALYLQRKPAGSNNPVSHALMTGGSAFVDDDCMNTFYMRAAESVRGENMPAVSEHHTPIFPFYVDKDLCITKEVISDAVIFRMAQVMTFQIQRFYEGMVLQCIVCTKTLGAKLQADGTYKHGIHIHWPGARVNIDMALQIRMSMIVGLERESWQVDLGSNGINWHEVIDEAVYRTGLRMIGAPKASPCPSCKGKRGTHCAACHAYNNNKIVDMSVYKLHTALTGNEFDAALFSNLNGNLNQLLRKTSVRCREHETLTPGYAVYAGCPPVAASSTKKGKRKADPHDNSGKVEARFRRDSEVTNPQIVQIMRKRLMIHCKEYEQSRMRILYSNNEYRVILSGDGSTYCTNKADYHNGNHAYMVVKQSKSKSYVSMMRCFCKKPTVRISGAPCSNWTGPSSTLEDSDIALLFKSCSGGSTSSAMDPRNEMARLAAEIDAATKYT